MTPSKYFISTAIPYVNSAPHVGHALEMIQADVLARWHRQIGQDVFFVTGTDENALKNAQAAAKEGIDVKELVDKYAKNFLDLKDVLNLSNDDFIRTTQERHIIGAQKLFKSCLDNGDIYKKGYTGYYCVGCESFKMPKELIEGKCPEHKTVPEQVQEENYFFELSKYQDKLLELVESDTLRITPSSRKNETAEFIRQGLEDFSVSRSRERVKNWGIPVPGDNSQIIYVWFDALTNYINAIGYGTDQKRFKDWWQGARRTHLVGKGITRFHAIYWPAMLMSAGLPLPQEIYVHGYVTAEGEKISKSLGNAIDPVHIASKYGADVLRYYLIREIPTGGDGDFSIKNLEARYNGDLANGLGNLVQRVATLIEGKLDGQIVYDNKLVEEVLEFRKQSDNTDFEKAMADFRLHDALSEVWRKIAIANVYVDEQKPWAQVKVNPEEFLKTMTVLVGMVHNISWILKPFIPVVVDKIFKTFGTNDSRVIENHYHFKINKGEILFPRLQ